jgi:hypothetical protein
MSYRCVGHDQRVQREHIQGGHFRTDETIGFDTRHFVRYERCPDRMEKFSVLLGPFTGCIRMPPLAIGRVLALISCVCV